MNLRKKNLLITGLPGVGKTTLIKKLSDALKSFHPVGFYTVEMREGGVRKGFELMSFEGKRKLLSHKEISSPYKVGQYKVNIKGFEDFLNSISFFNPLTRLIIIDEIGKMECLSLRFQEILKEILDAEKWVMATIALKGSGLIAEVKERNDVRLFEITKKNRDSLFSEILTEVDIENGEEPEEKIEVIAYSGYRDEEAPRTILFHGERIEVIEILKRWIEEISEVRSRKRFFKIKGSDGAVYLIYYDEKVMGWFHVVKD
jgi:nucleoside-triphosphatase